MAEQWQVKLGPCRIIPHPIRNGILLVTNTEVMSGEVEITPSVAITQQMVEEVIARHGKDFIELIANFQKFILGMLTITQREDSEAHGGYSLDVERCYELNRQQRLSLLKYLANEIVLRAYALSKTSDKYPPQTEFDKFKS